MPYRQMAHLPEKAFMSGAIRHNQTYGIMGEFVGDDPGLGDMRIRGGAALHEVTDDMFENGEIGISQFAELWLLIPCKDDAPL